MSTEIPEEYKPSPDGITLYTSGSPNGFKITSLLNVLGLKYKMIAVDLVGGVQYKPWYQTHISPTRRIPVLFDGGNRIFESGAITQYLIEKYDSKEHKISFVTGSPEWVECLQWFWYYYTAIEGPQVDAGYNVMFAAKKWKSPVLVEINKKRVLRDLKTFETRLSQQREKYSSGDSTFLVGGKLTYVDIIATQWTIQFGILNIDLDVEFPNIAQWVRTVSAIEEVKTGINMPYVMGPFKKSRMARI